MWVSRDKTIVRTLICLWWQEPIWNKEAQAYVSCAPGFTSGYYVNYRDFRRHFSHITLAPGECKKVTLVKA